MTNRWIKDRKWEKTYDEQYLCAFNMEANVDSSGVVDLYSDGKHIIIEPEDLDKIEELIEMLEGVLDTSRNAPDLMYGKGLRNSYTLNMNPLSEEN